MRKKDEASDVGSDWSAPVGGRVTPQDVQQKEFRVTRVGAGYRMREVDEFLDQITDTLSALIAENDRFRAVGGAPPSSSGAERGPAPTAVGPADRGAVDAFLQREKEFLQDLGGLVQAHAEELRSMIRAAKADAAAPAAVAEPAPDAEPAPAPEPVAAEPMAEVAPEPVSEAESIDEEPDEDAAPAGSSEDIDDQEEEEEEEDDDGETGTITRVVSDEPIRLEDPEPARRTRSKDSGDESLRELFWGEE